MENDAKSKIEMKSTNEFTEIVRLIEESRNRAFQKVNEELVLSNIVLPTATQKTDNPIVSPMATQLQNTEKEHLKFV